MKFCDFSSQVCQRMRVQSLRPATQPNFQGSSAARSRAALRCPLHHLCPAPPRPRHRRAPQHPRRRLPRQCLPGHAFFPALLLLVSRRNWSLHPLSPPHPYWRHHPIPSPTLLIHTHTRSPVFFPSRLTTHGQSLAISCITRCISAAASTTSGKLLLLRLCLFFLYYQPKKLIRHIEKSHTLGWRFKKIFYLRISIWKRVWKSVRKWWIARRENQASRKLP